MQKRKAGQPRKGWKSAARKRHEEPKSFTLPDPYKGWSVERLKRRCRKLVSVSMRKDMIILSMAGRAPQTVLALSPEIRDEVQRLQAAYAD